MADRQDVEFFNVGEVEELATFSGCLLSRIPAEVRHKLNDRARFVGRNSTCAEIRFVTDAEYISLRLAAIRNEAVAMTPEVKVMRGNFEHSRHPVALDSVTTINIRPPDFSRINERTLQTGGFAPNVWRVVCSSPSIVFCGIDTFGYSVRPPEAEEKPGFRCLCYGSSITNSNIDGWPMVMGHRLGIQVMNLGLAGACHVEPEIADYIASRSDWDGLVLELGINILGMAPDEFSRRVDYMLRSVTNAHPGKPVVMLTIFPCGACHDLQVETANGDAERTFNEILRERFRQYRDAGANIHLIEGSDILDSPNCLSVDFVHPRIYGHAVMGLNMASNVGPIFAGEAETARNRNGARHV